MRISTGTTFTLGVVAVILLNGENLRVQASHNMQVAANRIERRQRTELEKERAKAAQERSAIALEWAKTCTIVVHTKTGKQGIFSIGDHVTSGNGAKLPVRDGAVCNTFGEAALVENGRIVSVAKTTKTDLPKFKKILEGEVLNGGK